MKFRQLFVLIALVASLLLVACTTERDPVDKSPELSLDKTLFEGEFFYRQTVVDLPYTADYAFIGESNDGKILGWKITKNWLIAYNIHDNLEVVNTSEEPTINETPLLAYRILSHYDILPQENVMTGEDLPVYVANYDCNWNECRFFQIDPTYAGTPNFELKWMALSEYVWSAPYRRGAVTSATDFEFYAHDGSYIPAKLYSYRQKKADNKSETEVEMFTFRTQEQLIPSSWADFYTMADVDEFFQNEPANIWYRHTFTKVNREVYGRRTYDPSTKTWPWKKGSVDNGFRPLIFNDEQFRMFGYFTNKFKGYNPDHGYKDDSVYEMANYFNTAWGRLKKDASFTDGLTSGNNIDWNFVCDTKEGRIEPADYDKCLEDIVVQQKIVFTSSGETPKRMIAPNCAMAKDYNHSFLASRFAAMNPGSDTRDFEKWYVASYFDHDFFLENKAGGTSTFTRDFGWYTHPEDYPNWQEKCFIVPTDEAHVQKWNGDVIEDNYINEIGTLVQNPVEGFIAVRDGNHLTRFGNYDSFAATADDVDSDVNAIRICVPTADAKDADEYTSLRYFANCLTNDTQMTKLYTEEYGRAAWKGDRWDCRTLTDDETCASIAEEAVGTQADVDSWTEVRAACVLDSERNCKTYGSDVVRPMLRHKFMNGDATVAMWNWVDQPTEYGILGVSQWNINPETGQSFGAGSNVAGAVLQWSISRAIEMSRVLLDPEDPASTDWSDLVNPEYAQLPSKMWDNSPDTATEPVKMAVRAMTQGGEEKVVSVRPNVDLEALSQLPVQQKKFDYSSVRGTKWEGKMISYSVLKSLFPWSDPNEYNYSDDMKDTLSSLYDPEKTAIEMDRMIARGKNTYFEASFLDGAIIQFLQERQKIYQEEYPDWATSQKDAYTEAFLGAVSDDLEILMYKGVAEHEMGHSLGLRHNFISSADMFNYQDGYFSSENYPNLMNEQEKLVTKLTAEGVDPGNMGDEVYKLKRAYPFSPDQDENGNFVRLPGTTETTTPITYNMYVSIMDYQAEPYIHSIGLGKYDSAALKFVYGRTVERMNFDSEGFVEMHTDSKIRDARYPQPILTNTTYIRDDGSLKTVSDFADPRIASDDPKKNRLRASKLIRYYDEAGELKWRVVLDAETGYYGGITLDPELAEYTIVKPNRPIINDGSVYPYLFFSDETRQSEPASNVWDTGYLATDIIRSFRYNADKYYFLRYFRRGNPRFREFRGRNFVKMILGAYYNTYKYVHFLLDLNYNIVQRGWLWKMAIAGDTSYALTDDGTNTINLGTAFYDDYSRAMKGEEFWFATVKDDSGVPVSQFRELMPMEGGDYLLAGALGVDYFLSDVVYRPDSSADYMKRWRVHPDGQQQSQNENPYLLSDKLEVSQDGYWVRNGYIPGGLKDQYKLEVPYTMGRVQKNHWDIQDDPTIYYDKVDIKGFAEEKMVALYTLGNSGWVSSKYRRESMANSIGAYSSGFENTIFNMLSEVANEDVLFGLSPYCVHNGEMVRVSLPIQQKMNFFGSPPIIDNPEQTELPTNLCAYYGMATTSDLEEVDPEASIEDQQATIKANMLKKVKNAATYEPVQAGWTYFDKTAPLYWGMGSVSNVSADSTILWKFVTLTYPTMEQNLYPAIEVDEVEVLNSMGNRYYRAKLPLNDLTVMDRTGLASWKAEFAAGGTEEEALCVQSYVGNCANYCLNSDGEKLPLSDDFGNYVIDDYGVASYLANTLHNCDRYQQDGTYVKGNDPVADPLVDDSTAALLAAESRVAGLTEMLNKYRFYFENGYEDNIPAALGTEITEADIVPNKRTFTFYLRMKYSRFSPAFKLVWSLERNNTAGDGTISADPAAQSTTIMETTLDSMNAWAKDNLSQSVNMAFY